MKKKIPNLNIDKNGDFILRWKLEDLPPKKSKDPVTDFIKDVFRDLLDLIIPTYKGEDVRVDGFRLAHEFKVHKLFTKVYLKSKRFKVK